MPDYLKYSTTNVDYADQYGNIWIANDVGNRPYGASRPIGSDPGTGFYLNMDPPEGGYTIGIYRDGNNYPYFYQPSNDTELVNMYNHLFNTTLTTAEQVINAIDGDDDTILYGQIERDSLMFFFDAANTDSYPGNGSTWTDLDGNSGANATINGATFSNGVMQFDGTNDYINWGSNRVVDVPGFTFWVLWDLPTQTSGAWNYFLYHNPSGSHKYEFGQYGTGADTFHFKDNISYAGTAVFGNMSNTGYSSFAFGSTSNGRSFTSVNGANKTIKDPGSNSDWATGTPPDMTFTDLFRGAGTNLGANVKMIALYSKELSNDEITYNHRFGATHRL